MLHKTVIYFNISSFSFSGDVKIDYRLNPNANEFARTKDNPKLIHHYRSLPVTEWFFSTIRTFDKKTNNLGNTI